MKRTIRWGILGTGSIATEFASGVKASTSSTVAAVASRDSQAASTFASRFGIPVGYGSYEALIEDDLVDVVYVATPHPAHERWATEAIRAGRHVLCEKPLTVSARSAQRVIDAAAAGGTFLMEAFMYRLHPQTRTLITLLTSGAIGEPRMACVSFGFDIGTEEVARLTTRSLGGGGILDVGCYAVSVARLVASIASGVQAAEPQEVAGYAYLDPVERIDLVAVGSLAFAGGFLAQVSCAVRAQLDDAIRIFGTEGTLTVPRPCWLPEHRGPCSSVIVLEQAGTVRDVKVDSAAGVFAGEADHVAGVLPATQSPLVPWAETMANMRTLDRWRQQAGVTYDFE